MKRLLLFAALLLPVLSSLRGAEPLQLEANENLFYVLAAINAAGYNDGVALPDNNPLRQQLRDYLAKQNIPVLPELKRYYARHTELGPYISYALSVAGAPDFHWATRDVEVPPDALGLAGFTPLLIKFHQEANLAELYRRAEPVYRAEMEKYHSPLVEMTTAVNGYLRVPAAGYLGRRFRIFIDLLAAPEQVQTRNYGDNAFVVVTASAEPRMFDIRHAYLHFEIDPIVIKYGMDLDQKRSLLDLVQDAPLESSYKNDFVLLANESLIKAVEARIDRNASGVERAAKQGFALTPFFAEQLPVFEKQQQGMRFYFAEMSNEIDLRRETNRIQAIRYDAAPAVRAARQVNLPGPELSPAAKAIESGDLAYDNRHYEEAKQLFVKALELKGSPEEHSLGWYGIARIALRQNQPDEAVKFFERTLSAAPDPQTRAWCHVYLARLSKAASDPAAALKHYQEALAVEGASEQARKAAETELQGIPKV